MLTEDTALRRVQAVADHIAAPKPCWEYSPFMQGGLLCVLNSMLQVDIGTYEQA